MKNTYLEVKANQCSWSSFVMWIVAFILERRLLLEKQRLTGVNHALQQSSKKYDLTKRLSLWILKLVSNSDTMEFLFDVNLIISNSLKYDAAC